jgi:thioredoxin 2
LFTGKPVAADGKSTAHHARRFPGGGGFLGIVVWTVPGDGARLCASRRRTRAELEPNFRLLKVNADEEQQLMARYGIRSIPTLMLFARGRAVAQQAGAMNPTSWPGCGRTHRPIRSADRSVTRDGFGIGLQIIPGLVNGSSST